MTTMRFAILSVVFLLGSVAAQPEADPSFASWPFNIRPDPTPGIVGEDNTIDVTAYNAGDGPTTDLEIVLSKNDWGITYNGWTEIGRATIDSMAPLNYAEHTFTYVFEDRGHICLQAEYSEIGTGGNKITWNDRTQINWEVVYADEDVYINIPFGNGDDEEIVVNGTEIVCMINGTEVPCNDPYSGNDPNDDHNDFNCEGMDADGKRCCMDQFENVVPCCWELMDEQRENVMQNIEIPNIEIPNIEMPIIDDNTEVVDGICCAGLVGRVFCEEGMLANRRAEKKKQRAGRKLLQDDDNDDYVQDPPSFAVNPPSTLAGKSEELAVLKVPEIANNGMTVMVNAQLNGQANNVMIQIIKMTVTEMLNDPMFCCIKSVKTRVLLESMLVDALEAYEAGECKKAIKILRMLMQKMEVLLCDLDREEKACIEKALRRINDAARLISIRCCGADPMGEEMREGDYFRRAGLYQAALIEYARACRA